MTIRVDLAPPARQELEFVRDHDHLPYRRERAAGVLKVAAGDSPEQVAAAGLLRTRLGVTVRGWVTRYQVEGIAGLTMRPGRGRHPAFPPSAPDRGRRRGPAG